MNAVLEGLRGRRVQVWSDGSGSKDEGKLVDFDAQWVVLEKPLSQDDRSEFLYLSIYNIRLLKPV
jgi:hypothetical protein